MPKNARRKNRRRGEKKGLRRELGRNPRRRLREMRDELETGEGCEFLSVRAIVPTPEGGISSA